MAGRTPGGVDWSLGRYEETAAQLLPAAEIVVDRAEPRSGERVIDLGCGTGNAAMIAAAAGAHVTGVDPATRLLDVARRRAASKGLDIRFVPGEAESLPAGEASADVILSVFGLIFTGNPAAAAAEMTRVLTPGGRIVFSAWLPGGAIGQMNTAAADMVRQVFGAPPPPSPFAWHDLDTVSALFAPHGLRVAPEEHSLAFTAASPADYLDHEARNHPLAVAGFSVLSQHGQADTARARLLQILQDANEDPDHFRCTSRYIIVTAQAS
jgi:SAM-dependent methyltransferase